MFHYFFVCSMVVYMEIIVPLSWLFKQSGPAQACKGNFSRHSHLLVPSRSAQWDNGHFTCMQSPAWRPAVRLCPTLSLSPTGHGHNTNKSSCWPAPRQNPKPELRSTKHSLRVDRSQTAWPPAAPLYYCTSYVTGQFAASCC